MSFKGKITFLFPICIVFSPSNFSHFRKNFWNFSNYFILRQNTTIKLAKSKSYFGQSLGTLNYILMAHKFSYAYDIKLKRNGEIKWRQIKIAITWNGPSGKNVLNAIESFFLSPLRFASQCRRIAILILPLTNNISWHFWCFSSWIIIRCGKKVFEPNLLEAQIVT